MAEVDLNVKNAEQIIRAFAASPQIASRVTGLAVRDILAYIAGKAAVYPPAPANTTYTRTGALGREWTSAQPQINVGPLKIEGRVTNNRPYGPWVQDEENQAKIHAGRWKTIEQLIRESQQYVDSRLEEAGNQIAHEIEAQAPK